jgi:transcription antitermination factor NusG
MSSGGPPEPVPLPSGFQVGDRVRVVGGMFGQMVGIVHGPAPHPTMSAVLVRLRFWERDVDVGFAAGELEPAPPD